MPPAFSLLLSPCYLHDSSSSYPFSHAYVGISQAPIIIPKSPKYGLLPPLFYFKVLLLPTCSYCSMSGHISPLLIPISEKIEVFLSLLLKVVFGIFFFCRRPYHQHHQHLSSISSQFGRVQLQYGHPYKVDHQTHKNAY